GADATGQGVVPGSGDCRSRFWRRASRDGYHRRAIARVAGDLGIDHRRESWGQGPGSASNQAGRRAAAGHDRRGNPARSAWMNISAAFIRRPVMATLLMAAFLLAGFFGYSTLPVSELPNVDFPTIDVQANLPGADAETMASSVATPLE